MLSSLLLKQCPAGIGKWKPFYQTFLKKETLQENQTLASLVSIFLNIKAHILKIVYGSCFSQKNPAGHWMSLLLQKNTPESSQIRLWIRWGEVTQTWKWPFLSVNQHSTGGTWRLPCPCEQLEATNSMVLRSPSPSEGKSSMELMDLNSPVPRCASPLLASSPLVLPRCVPAEPLGPHNTSSLVSSLDSTLSLLPYSGAHCNKHVSKLAFNPRSRMMHHHGEPHQCRQRTFSRSALRLRSFPLWKPEKQALGVHKTLSAGVTRCRWCCCGILGGVNWDLLPTLHSRLKACCLIHACSNTGTQTHKTRQVKTTNYCTWGEKEGRSTLQTFVKLLNMVLQDPQIHAVWEEIWSTYMWRYVSFEVQSMPKAME